MPYIYHNGKTYGNLLTIDMETFAKDLLSDVARVEDSNVATANYSQGAYLVYNRTLYKVTASGGIASGATLIPGTNIAQTTAGTELISTKADVTAKANKTDAIKSITRSGTTFTATRADNTTFTFTQQDTDTNTWIAMRGASSSAAGAAGYVPAPPSAGYNTKYLRADGSWSVPPDNNTWLAMRGASSSAAGTAGYVPAPPSAGYNTKYLRADGSWSVPPDTNTNTGCYVSASTASAAISSLAASSQVSVTTAALSIPSGYSVLAVFPRNSTHAGCIIYSTSYDSSSHKITMGVRNTSTAAQTGITVTAGVLYIRTF